jgi:hypothetical protein
VSFAAFPLWALVAMAGATSAAVVALYLLRRTPRPQIVSNVEFWLRALHSARPQWLASFRIPILALLLSWIAALGIVTLIGDPRFGSAVRGTTIVVLDAGRTMGAVGIDGHRRLDRALSEIRRWVDRTTVTGEVAVVRAGMRPSVLLPITDAAADLDRALRALRLDDGTADLSAAVALADAILEERGALRAGVGQILVVSDRPVELSARAPIAMLPIGTAAETVAITGFAARRDPAGAGEYEVRCAVSGFAARRSTARLVIRDGEVTILDERVTIPPHQTVVREATGFSRDRAELVAELDDIEIEGGEDGLRLDDRAYAVVEPLETMRVLLVTDGNRYLEAALTAHPGVDTEVMGVAEFAARGSAILARHHVLVLDRAALPPGTEHPAVLAFAPPIGGPVQLGPPILRPRITGTLASHPALDGLRLDDVHFERATPLVESEGDRVLFRSEGHALAIARERGRQRLIVFGFATSDTDLVRGEGFPLLVHGALRWVSDRVEPAPLPRRLGGPLVVDPGDVVRDPDGQTLDRAEASVVPEVVRAGIWYVGERAIAFGGTEHAGPLGAGATGGRFVSQSTLPPLAVLIAVALLVLLLIEWALLHRGWLG